MLGIFLEYRKVRRVQLVMMIIQSIYMDVKIMFTADGVFIVLLLVVAYVGMKWYMHVKIKEMIRSGGFVFKGKQYDVYYLGRADNPSFGLPDVLQDPDNGAFAPETLSKLKYLSIQEKQHISTIKDHEHNYAQIETDEDLFNTK